MFSKPLTTIELTLQPKEQTKLTQSAGSLLQGVLMEIIDPDYAAQLHLENLRPYSQYLYVDRQEHTLKWRLSSLNQEAAQRLLELAWNLPETFRLKQKGVTVEITQRQCCRETDYDTLANTFLGEGKNYRKLHFAFLTSTTFKTNGTYALYPELELLFHSLLQRWNHFSDSEVIDAPDAVQELVNNLFVGGYDLKLHPFALEGTRVQAFRGNYTVVLKNNSILRRLAALLADYAQFSGVGIKTALGMGGTQVEMELWR